MSLTLSLNAGCQLGATRALHSASGDRMTAIIQSAWPRLAAILLRSYDADSRMATLAYASGSERTTYDSLKRAITQVEFEGAAAIVTKIDTYDVAGRKTMQNKNSDIVTYTYGDINRLTGQLQSGARATFVMDAVGNIEVKHHEGA